MKKKYIIILIVLFIVLIPFFISVKKFINKFDELSNIEINQTPYRLKNNFVSTLNVRTLKTETVSLNGLSIINFWASWCVPCIDEIPSFELLKLKKPDLNIYLFSFDSLNSLKKIISDKKWLLPAYFISDSSVFKNPNILPTTYILKNDTVVLEVLGKERWDDSLMLEKIKSFEN